MMKKEFVSSRPYVIVISGSVGSGKSTISIALSKGLDNASVLTFDHYGEFIEWPDDLEKWVEEGSNPNLIRVPKLRDNLVALMEGNEITDPLDGRTIKPSRFIILEEPSGREREEICEYIDLVVFVDTPQDICVIRLMERVLDMDEWNQKGTFNEKNKDDLVRQLDTIALWVRQYRQARSMYVQVSERAKIGADLIVNGMRLVEDITSQVLKEIRNKLGS